MGRAPHRRDDTPLVEHLALDGKKDAIDPLTAAVEQLSEDDAERNDSIASAVVLAATAWYGYGNDSRQTGPFVSKV